MRYDVLRSGGMRGDEIHIALLPTSCKHVGLRSVIGSVGALSNCLSAAKFAADGIYLRRRQPDLSRRADTGAEPAA